MLSQALGNDLRARGRLRRPAFRACEQPEIIAIYAIKKFVLMRIAGSQRNREATERQNFEPPFRPATPEGLPIPS